MPLEQMVTRLPLRSTIKLSFVNSQRHPSKDHVPNRPTLACLAMNTACHMQKPLLLLHHHF